MDNLIQELREKLPVRLVYYYRLVYCYHLWGESVVLGQNGFVVIIEEGPVAYFY